jgi:dTDP-4-dehydrorhamnose reductase
MIFGVLKIVAVGSWSIASSVQTFCPLSNVYLSLVTIEAVIDSINEILCKQITGIRHLCGEPEISYIDYAKSICRSLGVSTTFVVPRSINAETVINRHSSLAE